MIKGMGNWIGWILYGYLYPVYPPCRVEEIQVTLPVGGRGEGVYTK